VNPSSFINMPTFEQLKEEMGADYMCELIDAYCEDTPRLIAELQQAITDQNTDALRRAAHTIKSTSNSLGAQQLGALARELELITKEGVLDGAVPRVERLLADYDQVRQALKELCDG
jgi:HPt (histidine-containing phosphotransfer) domain-containing protein